MAKWNRDRQRRRSGKPAGTQEQPGAPLQPEGSEGLPQQAKSAPLAGELAAPEVSPADVEPAEELQPKNAGAAVAPPRTGRSRRGRRGKKRPARPPQGAQAAAQPLVPAYTATEGPRAPMAVSVAPGAPTGEAAELEEPPEAAAPAPAPAAPLEPAAKRPPKGAVVLSVGLPGSGKTTWFKRKGVTPLSSDLLRTLLFDSPTEQRHQDLVFSSLRSLLRARMMARMPMNYVDATNLSPKERRHWIRMAREFRYEVHAVYFDVPLETCLERNRRRQRIVPEDVMQRMAAKLRPPSFEEGFAKIIVVRVKHREPDEGAEPGGEPAPEE